MSDIMKIFDPAGIEERSFAIIEAEAPEPRPFAGEEWLVVRRLIHTSADFELLSLARFHPDAVVRGIEALKRGCLVVTDTGMARAGITTGRMERLGCEVACYLNDPIVIELASKEKKTRTAVAVDHAVSRLTGNICVVGNAPTALLRLLELIRDKQCRPALIVGMPVGFVNARESKELLMAQKDISYITIEGRKGGSALAAAVVNQLAEIAIKN